MDVRPPRGGAKGEGQSAEVTDDRMKELAWEKEEMEKKQSTDADVDRDGQSAEVTDDRMKELAWEKEEMEKKQSTDADVDRDGDGGSALVSSRLGSTDGCADNEPVSKKQKKMKKKKTKEPTPEHLLIREKFEVARKWEIELRAKHTEGQAAEIMGRIFDNRRKAQFPSEIPHNWTKELMEETKIGWQKWKGLYEIMDKYPKQNMEQFFKEDTEEWIMQDLEFWHWYMGTLQDGRHPVVY